MAYDVVDGVRYPQFGHENWHIDYNYSLRVISDRERATTAQVGNNTPAIATNTADIATNTSAISTNTSNISANASSISTNASNIATNSTNISTNTSNIATNTTDIASNTNNITQLLDPLKKTVYVIPLTEDLGTEETQWTIVEGDNRQTPVTGYSQAQWDVAYNNKIGITKALNYAASKGCQVATLPTGHYNICYSNVAGSDIGFIANEDNDIIIPSGVRFEAFNDVDISVLWDSDTIATTGATIRNPYDAGSYTPNELRGNILAFSKSYNSKIIGINLIGEQSQRSYVDPDENKREHTTGVYIREGSTGCGCYNVETTGFSGDGHSGVTSHNSDFGSQLSDSEIRTFYPGQLDRNDGTIDAGITTSYTTNLVSLAPIDQSKCDSITMRTNLGFRRIPEFKNQKIILAWYDASDVFLASEDFSFLETTKIYPGAAKIRLGCMGEADSQASINFTLRITPPAPDDYEILHCTVKENNRGGISNMPNRTLIAHNKIYNNGTGAKEGRPEFFYDTQYGINVEDSLGHSVRIYDNEISGTRHGILTSGVNIFIRGNTITNCIGSGVSLYYMINANISDNTFNNCGQDIGVIDYGDPRSIISSNNISNSDITADFEVATATYDFNIVGGIANNRYAMYRPHLDRIEDFKVSDHVYNQTPLLDKSGRHEYIRGKYKNTVFNLKENQVSTNYVYTTTAKGSDLTINCTDPNRRIGNEGTTCGLSQNGGKQYRAIIAAASRTYNFYGEGKAVLNPDMFEFPQLGTPNNTTHELNFYDYTLMLNGGFSWLFNMDTNSSSGTTTLNMNFYNCKFLFDAGIGGTLFYIDYYGADHNVNINLNYCEIDTQRTAEIVYLGARHASYVNSVLLTKRSVVVKGALDETATGFNIITV